MKNKVLFIIIGVVLVLALLITGTVLFLNSRFSQPTNTDTSSQSSISDTGSSQQSSDTSDTSGTDSSVSSGSQNSSDTSDVSVQAVTTKLTNLIVGNVTAAKGDKVSIPVYVRANKGFMGITTDFKYDTALLKYTGFKRGDLLSDGDMQQVSNGTLKFLAVENGDVTNDGILLYLEFEVLSEEQQVIPINIIVGDNYVGNQAEELVDVYTVNGSITIK